MLIDTHAHLDYTDFSPDRDEVIQRAQASGVSEIICIGTTVESSAAAIRLAKSSIYKLWATAGVHPCEADSAAEDFIFDLRNLAAEPCVVALGEIGLDYHRLPATGVEDYKAKQADVFIQQLDLAAELNLNVVIHERDSWDDTLHLLKQYTGRVRGVFHCFGGTQEQAYQLFDLGHLVSFTGIVTFKNAWQVQQTAKQLKAGTFMVETDCPYLAPAPFRGKRCEPSHTTRVAEFLAELRLEKVEDLAANTTATAREFFHFQRL